MFFIGVDVGTGSARAGLFSGQGQLIRHSSKAIKTWVGSEVGHSEQSTSDIWSAVCSAIQVSSYNCISHDINIFATFWSTINLHVANSHRKYVQI